MVLLIVHPECGSAAQLAALELYAKEFDSVLFVPLQPRTRVNIPWGRSLYLNHRPYGDDFPAYVKQIPNEPVYVAGWYSGLCTQAMFETLHGKREARLSPLCFKF